MPRFLRSIAYLLAAALAGCGQAVRTQSDLPFTPAAARPAAAPHTSAFSVIYSFKGTTDGWEPNNLIAMGTTLYGTTFYGGSCYDLSTGCGIVFRIEQVNGKYVKSLVST